MGNLRAFRRGQNADRRAAQGRNMKRILGVQDGRPLGAEKLTIPSLVAHTRAYAKELKDKAERAETARVIRGLRNASRALRDAAKESRDG